MLEQILKDSAYKLTQFNSNEVAAVEEKIYQKSNGKFYMKCLIRDKEILLKPEEIIRQLFIYKLLNFYGYPKKQIQVERAVHFGREVKRADIVIMEKDRPDVEYIIVEVKKPKLKDGKEQLRSYCNATGATMGVWTNGNSISYYHRKDPNYFEDIPNIPHFGQKLKDILTERWTIQDLIDKDKLAKENKSLKDLILEMEDEVLANAGVDVFEEVFKLIYTKLYDEKLSANNKSRFLQFRNYGETDAELKETIQVIFDAAKNKWQGVFVKDDKLKLTPSHLAICISSLQNVKLFNSNLEVIDEAFEYLMSKSQKGEKGQYFTPRYVIDMCVKMLNPKENEFMIDTAAGSCGFPVHTIFHVWKKFGDSELFTAEDKPPQFVEYVQQNIFAIDFDEKAVRVARTLNLIAGDGKTNVLWLNTLDYERWNEYIDDEDWKDIYDEGWGKLRKLRAVRKDNRDFNFDILMANPPFAGDIKESRLLHKYELAKKSNGKYQTSMSRDVLFIERNLQFLKPGGRMAIILPQGRFNNSSDKYIRDFIAERCRILAVVGLHGNVFKPHTGTKTSVLFVQKWDDELCPYCEDYKIFFATMQKPSKDNSGDKIYCTTAEGLLRDKHNHLIVDHDLFAVEFKDAFGKDVKTDNGIAEAFIEFAKREKLSFFDSGSFNELHYNRLLEELECTEIFLSECLANKDFRCDSDFYIMQTPKNKNFVYKKIGDCIFSAQYGISIEMNEDGVGFPIYRMNEIHNQLCDLEVKKFADISFEEFLKFKLNDKDVLFNRTNSYEFVGRTGIYYSKCNDEKTFASYLVRFVCNTEIILPEYLTAFLNTKFGISEIKRRARQSINQTNVNPEEVKEIEIPILSMKLQSKISLNFERAFDLLIQADETYRAAENILAQALHLQDFKPSSKNTAEINFSASFGKTGRLDAEYYQPKYDDIEKKLASELKINDEFNLVKTICSRTEKFYNYIEIGDVNISNGVADSNLILTENLPDNAKIMTQAGDILVSKVRPNRGAVAILTENNLLVSGAFAVLRMKGNFLKEVLQVLLRLPVYRELMLKFNVGTSYPVIKDEDVLNLPLPKIDVATQEKISALVEKSFELRAESKRLLEVAKLAVEMAIERGENAATEYLRRGENFGD